MKIVGLFAVLVATISLLVVGYFRYGNSWRAVAKEDVGLFRSERDAAYNGSKTITTEPAISSVRKGEPVSVLWDTYGKDYWACYIRNSTNQLGWVLCTSLRQAA